MRFFYACSTVLPVMVGYVEVSKDTPEPSDWYANSAYPATLMIGVVLVVENSLYH